MCVLLKTCILIILNRLLEIPSTCLSQTTETVYNRLEYEQKKGEFMVKLQLVYQSYNWCSEGIVSQL